MAEAEAEATTAYLAKADESLAGAERECAVGASNNCANRAYYACFQAAIAALIRIGVGPSPGDERWRHDAVQAQFIQHLINRRKRYSADMRGTLERGARLRATADYQRDQVSAAQATRGLRRAQAFVSAVRSDQGRIR